MPTPENLLVYGRTDLLNAVAHAQPIPSAGQPAFNVVDRQVTRTITFHFSAGWQYSGWNFFGNWFGTVFNIDLDGTLFQCQEMSVRTLHVGGTPHFIGSNTFVNDTSLGVEMCRFGAFKQHGTDYRPKGLPITFSPVAVADEPVNGICDYSPGNHPPGGTLQFNIRKIRGGTLVNAANNSVNRNWYYVKLHLFDDIRNPKGNAATGSSSSLYDALYTEEQQQTMMLWAKAMCEINRIPKRFFIDPSSGKQQPWIRDTDLVGSTGTPGSSQRALHNEKTERAKFHQGIMGHINVQTNRLDPGPSVDYYRIRRGISDEWWLPVDSGGGVRALDYLNDTTVSDYMLMKHYRDEGSRQQLYQQMESGAVGFYPFGENRVWHGGTHVTGTGSVYAMANGVVVCARVSNGNYNMDSAPDGTTVSRCFVLVRHDVHVLDDVNVTSAHWEGNRTIIDYGDNSTRVLYTLYMHLEPYVDQPDEETETSGRLIARDTQGRYALDWDNLPWWLNRYLIDNPNDANVVNGNVIFPNERIELSDIVGWKGTYITGKGSGGTPTYGSTAHIELFTTENPEDFSGSPWVDVNNRIEDPNDDVICDIGLVDGLILDTDGDGLEDSDIRDCLPMLRDKAVKFRSEWSLSNKSQLGQQLVSWGGLVTRSLGEVMDDATFNSDILPLMFHADMVAGGTLANIGPFFNQTKVWHLHPLTFMRWMNDRVAAHEQVLRNQSKQRNNEASNLRIENDYIVGWEDPAAGTPATTTLNQNTGQTYPEAAYGGNTYEVRTNAIADHAALLTADQTRTKFHIRLLDYLDHMNDRPQGVTVTRAWETTPATTALLMHGRGNAVLVTPATGTSMIEWYHLVQNTIISLGALTTSYPEYGMSWRETPTAIQDTGDNMVDRINDAANTDISALTTAPAIPAIALSAMRLQIRIASTEKRITVRFTQIIITNTGNAWLPSATWSVAFRVNGEMVTFLNNVTVTAGQIIPLPQTSNMKEFILDKNDTAMSLLVEGNNIGIIGNEPLDRATTTINLNTISTTPQHLSFAPASGNYRVEYDIFES